MKTPRLSAFFALATATAAFQVHLKAEDWNVPAGNWNDPLNWTPASVPNGTPANINNGGTATLDSPVSNALSVLITNASTLDFLAGGDLTLAGVPNNDHLVVNSGAFNMSGGTFNMNGQHLAADPGGIVNLTGGTFTNAGWFHQSGGTATVNFTNPADSAQFASLFVGRNGPTAVTDVLSGTLKATGWGEIGQNNSTGTLNVTGPNSHVEVFTGGEMDNFFRVGSYGGNGFVNVTGGGTLDTHGGWFTLGDTNGGPSATGEALISGTGSTLTSRGLIVGWNGATSIGRLTVEDNAVVNNTVHELSIGRDNATTAGYVNINSGGVLNAGPETRIGHNGFGQVNIDGGTLNMQGGGWAILGEGGAANGTLNMTSGAVNVTADRFVLGQNVGSVGVYNQTGGATDVGNEFNVGRGGGTGTLNLEGGTFNVHGWTTLGRDGPGTGTINVSNGAIFTHNELGGDFLVGWTNGSQGTVNVTSGAQMTYNWWIRMGIDPGSTGNLVVDGPGTLLDHNNGTGGDSRLVVGEAGLGTMLVSNEAQVNDGGNGFFVGWRPTGNGTVVVDSGAGLAVKSGWIQVGIEPGSVGEVTFDGAGTTVTHDIASLGYSTAIGQAGTGKLTISNGAIMNDTAARFIVGRDSGGSGTMRVTNGSMFFHQPPVDPNSDDWAVFVGGTHEGLTGGLGLMEVLGGSVVQANTLEVGRKTPFGGTLNVSDSAVTLTGHFSTGRNYDNVSASTPGLVNLTNSSLGYGAWLSVGHEGGNGVMNITDSTITGNGDFNVGIDQNGAVSPTTGVVNMDGGSSIMVPTMPIGRNGGTGTFNLNGGLVTVTAEVNVGNGGAATLGTLNVDGAGSLFQTSVSDGNPRFFVGRGGARGRVNVSNGGALNSSNMWFTMGNGDGSLGETTVTGPGSSLTSDGLIVGWNLSGEGILNVEDGAIVTNTPRELSIGRDHPNTKGTVNINTGGVLDSAAPRIGHNGIGFMNIEGGGALIGSGDTIIGDSATAVGTVTMSGDSLLSSSSHFYVGNAGEGTYNQSGGFLDLGASADRRIQIANQPGSTGTFNITGGTVSVSQWIHVSSGAGSTGTLNVNFANPAEFLPTVDLYLGNGGGGVGVVNVDSGTLNLRNFAEIGRYDGTGTLNVTGADSHVEAFTSGAFDGFFRVGGSDPSVGHGIVNVSAGGSLDTHGGWFTLGQNAGSLGEATVTGSGSTLNSSGLIVGWSGQSIGTLRVQDSAVVTNVRHEVSIGRDLNGVLATSPVGTVTVESGGVLNAGNDLRVGHGTTGFLNMDGGIMNGTGGWAMVGDGAASVGLLTMANGSVWNQDTGRIYIGNLGQGELNVDTGSSIVQTNGDQFNVGGAEGSSTGGGSGVVTITDSTLSTNNMIRIGFGAASAVDPSDGTLNLNTGSITAGGWIGIGHDGGNGVLNMTGGSISFGNEFYVGIDDNGHPRTTTGTASVSGGSITQTGGGAGLFVGRNGGNGLLDIVGTDPVAISILNEVHIGQGGVGAGGSAAVGTVNIDNPNTTFTVTNGLYVGQDGGTGVVNQNTGTVSETNQWLTLGAGGGSTGTYNLGDGAVNANFMEVGADGIGTFNISGGTSTSNQVTVGTRDTGVGVVNVSGGLFQSNGAIFLGGDQSGGSGTINSTGGVTQAVFIEAHANGVGFLSMDGGTLRAGANEGNFLRNFNPANSEIAAGGVTIDSNAFTITAQNQFDGPGALAKVGTGTLRLTGDNLYAGGTTVTNGNLYVSNTVGSGTGPGDVTVTGASSVLGGLGTISGSVTASSSGSVAPGESTGVLSVGTNVTFSVASNLIIEIDGAATPTNDTLNVTGTLDVSGAALVLNITGAPAQPFYIIANYGVLVGTFASATPPVGYTLDYFYGGNSIALVSSAADPFTTWIAGFPTGGLDAKLDDADGDGVVNLLEFALGGSDPTNPSATPDLIPGLETVGPDTYFTASTLMRVGGLAGVVGVGAPTNATAIDNLRYTVEGTVDLTTWATAMEPTTVPGTLPPAPVGWEWTTFRHVAPVALADISQARIRVESPF